MFVATPQPTATHRLLAQYVKFIERLPETTRVEFADGSQGQVCNTEIISLAAIHQARQPVDQPEPRVELTVSQPPE